MPSKPEAIDGFDPNYGGNLMRKATVKRAGNPYGGTALRRLGVHIARSEETEAAEAKRLIKNAFDGESVDG